MDFETLITQFIVFSKSTFTQATCRSSLEKCRGEIKEVERILDSPEEYPDHDLIEEYVDCIMCLIDSAARAGFTPEEIRASFSRKLLTNQRRTWKLNPDNTYSHVK